VNSPAVVWAGATTKPKEPPALEWSYGRAPCSSLDESTSASRSSSSSRRRRRRAAINQRRRDETACPAGEKKHRHSRLESRRANGGRPRFLPLRPFPSAGPEPTNSTGSPVLRKLLQIKPAPTEQKAAAAIPPAPSRFQLQVQAAPPILFRAASFPSRGARGGDW